MTIKKICENCKYFYPLDMEYQGNCTSKDHRALLSVPKQYVYLVFKDMKNCKEFISNESI
jgi:hypothetical protein